MKKKKMEEEGETPKQARFQASNIHVTQSTSSLKPPFSSIRDFGISMFIYGIVLVPGS